MIYRDANVNEDPYSNVKINSKFYDMSSIQPHSFGNLSPLYMSVNIQSLNSKHEELSSQICELLSKNICIDVIALQETWNIQYPDQLVIPGFQQPVFVNRYGMRGGGLDFM
jgi:hypothetical protein